MQASQSVDFNADLNNVLSTQSQDAVSSSSINPGNPIVSIPNIPNNNLTKINGSNKSDDYDTDYENNSDEYESNAEDDENEEDEYDGDNENDNENDNDNNTDNNNDNNNNHNNNDQPKPKPNNSNEKTAKRRMIACKRCHSLKVKCVPVNPSIEYGNCKRCVKKKIQCEYKIINKSKKPLPLSKSMKLKLKNDEIRSLKEELIKKDKLIKLLRGFTDDEEEKMSIDLSPQDRLQIYTQEIKELENISNDPINANQSFSSNSDVPSDKNSSQFIINSERRVQIAENQMSSLDILGNNLLSYIECTKLLNIFLIKIHPKFPFVELPKNLSLEYLRENEPLLFVIMIYIATIADNEPSTISVETQLQLECLISKSISLEILLIGNKNFQLLKNTLIYSFWYIPPELFHHRRYHMFASLCVSMAHDLGINGRPYFFYNKDDGSVKKASILNDNKKLELKSLVLVVYSLYMSISLFLKRIIFLQWSDFLDECCIILENSNLRHYKLIVMYARINHLLELIHNNIHKSSEQITVIELSSKKYKLQISDYLNDLNNLKQKISNNFQENSSDYNALMAYIYSVQAYLYEPAIQTLIKSKENITKEYKDVFFSTLSQICDSCLLSLKHFNKLSIDEISVNPLFHTSRILYTSGMLLRIRYLSLTIPKNKKASIFTEECISTIKNLCNKVDETAKIYPKNHFIKKVRIVLGLFIHTCLSQWYISYKALFNEIKKHTPLFVDPMLSSENLKRRKLNNKLSPHTCNQSINTTGMLPSLNSDSLPIDTTNSNIKQYTTHPIQAPIIQSRTSSYSLIQSPPTPILQVGSMTPNSNIDGENNNNSNISNTNSHNNNNNNYPQVVRFSPSNMNNNINNVLLKKDTINTRFPINNNISNINNNINNNNQLNPITQQPLELPTINLQNSTNHPMNNFTDNWELQYRAFNDEFWSDLFFGDGDGDGDLNLPDPIRMDSTAYLFNPTGMVYPRNNNNNSESIDSNTNGNPKINSNNINNPT